VQVLWRFIWVEVPWWVLILRSKGSGIVAQFGCSVNYILLVAERLVWIDCCPPNGWLCCPCCGYWGLIFVVAQLSLDIVETLLMLAIIYAVEPSLWLPGEQREECYNHAVSIGQASLLVSCAFGHHALSCHQVSWEHRLGKISFLGGMCVGDPSRCLTRGLCMYGDAV